MRVANFCHVSLVVPVGDGEVVVIEFGNFDGAQVPFGMSIFDMHT